MTRITARLFNLGHDFFFKKIHGWTLIYNTCWEDPRIDREILRIGKGDKVAVITSAGCNAIDYLLDSPEEIHAVDVNPRQNALLELKKAMISSSDYDDFFKFFGNGSHPHFRKVYNEIRHLLSQECRSYWNKNINYFSPKGIKKSFYYRGTSGVAAWIFKQSLLKIKPKIRRHIYNLFEAKSLQEQKTIYKDIEPQLWNVLTSWIVRQPIIMTMLGVPRPQIKLILEGHPGGLTGYIKDKLKHVFTEVPIWENYFWHVYFFGYYKHECCPNYLMEKYFSMLRTSINRVHIHTDTVSGLLRKNPGEYTHYILLDHQDWMAYHKPEELKEEWKLILENSRKGTKIIMRSAAFDINFIPDFAKNALKFHPEVTQKLHLKDRVGTYGSFHFGEVK